MSKNYRFHIPYSSIAPIKRVVREDYAPRYQQGYIDRYHFILDYLAKESSYRRKEIPIHSATLSKILGVKNSVTAYLLDNLVSMGFIELVEKGVKDVKSSSYRLTVKDGDLMVGRRVNTGVSDLAKRILDRRESNNEAYRTSVDGILYRQYLDQIELDEDYLISIINYNKYSLSPYDGELELLEPDDIIFESIYSNVVKIFDKEIFLKRPIEGSRVYCNFSMLHKEFRQYLHVNGSPLLGADLGCSQPLLAGAMMRDYCATSGTEEPKDLGEFIRLCEERALYEEFMTPNMIGNEVLRGEFKKNFFGSVFFSKPTPAENDIKTAFIEKFPDVYKLLVKMKGGYRKKGNTMYKQFPEKLQKFEASIMYDNVNRTLLLDQLPCFNIYDSIVSHREDVIDEAIKRMREAFRVLGVSPTIVLEDFRANGKKDLNILSSITNSI